MIGDINLAANIITGIKTANNAENKINRQKEYSSAYNEEYNNFKTPFSLESNSYYTVVNDINPADYNSEIQINVTAGKTDILGKESEFTTTKETKYSIGAEDSFSTNSTANQLIFELPDWGVEDYINDRSKWQKGIKSIGDEPGFFYFKVFFKFNTNYGLFGGVLSDGAAQLMSSNSALRYLNGIKGKYQDKFLYNQEQIPMRINALLKFTSALSKINSDYPWIIKGINGLETVMGNYVDNFHEEKSLELVFNTETIDMKMINILNLYKYACFDDINCKEIIPANLRKFDMMIVFYHVPLKYFQTAIMTSPKKNLKTGLMKPGSKLAKAEDIINKTVNFLTSKSTFYKYKRMNPVDGFSNMMSFQMFTFQNCEFDITSFNNYFSGAAITNEQPFQFVEIPIKIKYDRVYFHNMNEWNQMFYGSDGFMYDVNFPDGSELPNVEEIRGKNFENKFTSRLEALKEGRENSYFYDKNATQYKSVIDYAESMITDGLMSMDMKDYYAFIKGNIYGGQALVGSDYYKEKLSVLKTGNVKGNIYGRDFGSNKDKTGYFDQKIKMLKNGTISGNIYGKDFNSGEYMKDKIRLMNDGKASPETIREDIKAAFNKLKDNETGYNSNYDNLTNLQNKAPEDPYQRDPIKTKKKEIWNYALSGSSNGFLTDTVNDLNNIARFWKFR